MCAGCRKQQQEQNNGQAVFFHEADVPHQDKNFFEETAFLFPVVGLFPFFIFVFMASNRTKDKKKKESPEQLKQEKEEQINVKELVKDERTHKIAGIALFIVSLVLFIAFTSYLFTWKEDQDKVLRHGAGVLFDEEVTVSNLLGRFGAWVSHLFFYKGFGVASYLVCTFFFIVGANFLFGKKLQLPRYYSLVLSCTSTTVLASICLTKLKMLC